MKTKTLLVLTLVRFLTLPALAEPESLGTVKLTNGSQLEDVKLLKVEPDGLRLEHRSGVARVPLEDLPEDLARRFSLDEATATAWRREEKQRIDRAADEKRQLEIRLLAEKSRDRQNEQAAAERMDIFDQTKAPDSNYARIDEQVRHLAALWKDAGREDLAARFEEDREVLKKQEMMRPAADSDTQALAARVAGLEAELAEARNRLPDPASTTVLIDTVSSFGDTSGFYYPAPIYYPGVSVFNPASGTLPGPWCPPGNGVIPPGHNLRPPAGLVRPAPTVRPPYSHPNVIFGPTGASAPSRIRPAVPAMPLPRTSSPSGIAGRNPPGPRSVRR